IALTPGNISAGLGAIRLYKARKNTAKALDVATALRTAAPLDARVAHALGALTYETGDHARALGLLQDAARRGLEDPAALYNLAEVSYSMGRVEEARTALEDALRKHPEFSQASEAREFLRMISISTD